MNFVDRIFVGELTSTIMCEECEHVIIVFFLFVFCTMSTYKARLYKLFILNSNNIYTHNFINKNYAL